MSLDKERRAYAPSKPTFWSLLSSPKQPKGLVLSRSSMQVGSFTFKGSTSQRAPGGKTMNGLLLQFHYLTDLLQYTIRFLISNNVRHITLKL
jgi:hypothetical protein